MFALFGVDRYMFMGRHIGLPLPLLYEIIAPLFKKILPTHIHDEPYFYLYDIISPKISKIKPFLWIYKKI